MYNCEGRNVLYDKIQSTYMYEVMTRRHIRSIISADSLPAMPGLFGAHFIYYSDLYII